ncbi:type VI secretion system-associated FHA domain protein TagH [Halocynthiibacter namhaensis]|uniref:type VI secretion system-associated FHA domain protein TagH n=1 Tax=Halocynthiibacter namhaensis TaxID=1290553 RepID=UPI00068E33F0|nr:type VI secretion system-associated FHA domain protein TagH [Halocynthiibacter namhaensis]
MKATLQIMNVQEVVPALSLSFTFSQRGGIIGGTPEASWHIQDVSGNIMDAAARIMQTDGEFTLEPLSGMPIHINGAKAAITSGRPVILSDKDTLKIGDLECLVRCGKSTNADTRADVLNMSSFAAAASGEGEALVIDGVYSEASEITDITPAADVQDPLAALNQNTGRSAVVDPLNALDDHMRRSRPKEENRLVDDLNTVTREEKTVTTQPDNTNSANASLLPRRVRTDQYGFEDDEAQVKIDAATINLDHPVDHVALRPLTRALGLPLGDMSTEEASRTLADIGGALRAAVGGLNKIYVSRQDASSRFPLATMHLHAVEDNPLRFSGNTDEALHALFAKRGAVHLSAPAAVKETVEHLDAHQNATEVAIDKALDSVLTALLPRALERRFRSYAPEAAPKSGVEKDAWCWDMYKAYFSELKSTRQKGLQMLFWEVFQHEYQGIMRSHELYGDADQEDDE